MSFDFFRWRSLKTRVTLFTLAIFVIGIWSLSFYASRMLREDMQRLLGEQQFSTASFVAAEVNTGLADRVKALELIARAIEPSMLNNHAALQDFLSHRFVLHSQFNAGVLALSRDGTAIADVSGGPSRIGTNYADYDAVHAALTEGRSLIGKPVMGRKLHTPVFTIVVPIRDAGGKVIGALGGTTNLDKPNFLEQITQQHYGLTGGYLLVAPQFRIVVTATDKSRIMQPLPAAGVNPDIDKNIDGFEGYTVLVNPFGVEQLASIKRVPVSGWYLAAALPIEEAFAPIRAMQQRMLVATIFLTLLAGGLTWWMLRRQLSPMLAAVKTLATLSDSRHPPQSLRIVRQDEIGDLIGGFNRLLDTLRQRENALNKSETFTQAILNSVAAEIAVLDRDGVIIAVNAPWRRFSVENGIEPGKPAHCTGIGSNYLAACQTGKGLSPDGAMEAYDGIRAVLEGRLSNFSFEYPCHSPQQQRWFSMSVTPMGKAVQDGVVVTHTDISERKLIEQTLMESESRFREIFNTVSDAIFIHDAETGHIIDVNQRMCEMYGLTREQAIGCDADELSAGIPPYSTADVIEKIRRACTEGPQVFEWLARAHDGHLFWVEVSLRLAHIGKQRRILAVVRDISERKRADARLVESESRLRAIIENEPECIKIVDAMGNLKQMNPAGLAMIEADSQEQVVGRPVLNVIAPEHRPAFAQMHQRVLEGEAMQLEFEVLGIKGTRRWLETHAVPMQDNGAVVHLAVTRDITERKLAEEKLRLAASVFTHAREGIMITQADGTIIDINDTFSSITGYSREEVLGCNPRMLSSGRQGKEYYALMWQDLLKQGYWYGEIWNRRKNGEVYAEMLTISAVRDAQGNIRQFVALFSDITVLKEHEKQLEHIAHYDALTNLPNRVLLADRLYQGMSQVQRRKQRLAVAYLDLDGFKAVNDNYGHEIGDKLLMTVAARMKKSLREGDTLARLGGDEFVAVLHDLDDVEASLPMLSRLLAAAAEPVKIGELMLNVSASLGVTFYPQMEEVDADQLLRQADQAMYQAKLAGKNRYQIFDAHQDSNIRIHHESVARIRLALAEHEFVLYYQPKVNMRTGAVIGAEALIRWQHPDKGLLLPAVFLPVIEDHALAIEIGEWVIDTALTQMARWHAQGLDIPVSVNIGARQLQQANFVERLSALLAQHPEISPGCLELEVLETSALEDLIRVSQVMEACREIGVMFALDDFGTGYSSLTYLKRLPVKLLKVDQSFVRDMLDDPDDLAILEGVLGLATAFRREVIAEGVEGIEHGAMLLQLGCELGQGYGIARPMPAHAMPDWSANWRPDVSWNKQPPVSRDDLPLLFASVEHRAWIVAVEACIKNERETPPPLDQHLCRFGQWLDSAGLARHGTQPAFKTIERLHREVHVLAAELLELHFRGDNQQARARLGELNDLRDTLLEQLKILVWVERK